MKDPQNPTMQLLAQRGRWIGYLYAFAAVLSVLTQVVPHGPGYDETGLVAVTVVVTVMAVVFGFRRRPAGDALVHFAVVLAGLVTTAEVHFTDGLPNAGTLFYVWIVLFAFYFFSIRGASFYLAFVVVLYLLSALWTKAPYPLAAHTVATIGALAGSAFIVGALKRRIEMLIEILVETARTDPLTGLPNRRAFDDEMTRTVARSRRTGAAITLAVLDLDHFKAVNDQLGHPAGDAVLRRFADVLKATIRDGDVPARIGGEEFAVLIVAGAADGAGQLADRLVDVVRHTFASDEPPVTVSIGLATSPPDSTLSAEELMSRADAALYEAKRAGRDRVVAYDATRADSRPNEKKPSPRTSAGSPLPESAR